MYDLHNAYNYQNIVFIYLVQFSIRVSFACEFISMQMLHNNKNYHKSCGEQKKKKKKKYNKQKRK
jgi:hypothetical protein